MRHLLAPAAALLLGAAEPPARYDLLIRNAVIYDGSGGAPYPGELGVRGDRIVCVRTCPAGQAASTVDARGQALSPGFVNMLSHARESLLHDGRAMSAVLQGVTLEVNSELSHAPLTPAMRAARESRQGLIKTPLEWSTLGGYLDRIERGGVSVNVASYIGAGSVREFVLGANDVDPTPDQLARMRALVRDGMREGALGLATMLIYVPERYAETPELVALAGEAGRCGGLFAAHIRNEGDALLEALDEMVAIGREARVPIHVHHLKQSLPRNWPKLGDAVRLIEAARASGLRVTADMYLYPASGTGANTMLPAWVQEGGIEATIERLRDPATRARAKAEMRDRGPEHVLFSGFKTDALRQYTGKRLSEVMRMRGDADWRDTVIDLIVADGSRVGTVFFIMSEDNVRRQTALPWMTFGSDSSAIAAEGLLLRDGAHPRTYGNFARLLGKYVRDERTMPLAEAVRKLTALPADTLHLRDRGRLRPGAYADLVIFNPATIRDNATFETPHRYATGVAHVWVNGVHVVRDGAHTGAKPGRSVRGPGWTGHPGGGACR
ncbi:N-acyl-D-amino-acid deacylase family protein [Sphingomonas lenta]|uniref:Aminoacylase n=1 Tax=Sphingomonas lenta TaxID=1141887 RepID=A0A2A2SD32_9SPHN|nr:D-aminoacylase [Sphingomonas lenta]PAX07092.1 aminoacylase [Sphingomonas lenta]